MLKRGELGRRKRAAAFICGLQDGDERLPPAHAADRPPCSGPPGSPPETQVTCNTPCPQVMGLVEELCSQASLHQFSWRVYQQPALRVLWPVHHIAAEFGALMEQVGGFERKAGAGAEMYDRRSYPARQAQEKKPALVGLEGSAASRCRPAGGQWPSGRLQFWASDEALWLLPGDDNLYASLCRFTRWTALASATRTSRQGAVVALSRRCWPWAVIRLTDDGVVVAAGYASSQQADCPSIRVLPPFPLLSPASQLDNIMMHTAGAGQLPHPFDLPPLPCRSWTTSWCIPLAPASCRCSSSAT